MPDIETVVTLTPASATILVAGHGAAQSTTTMTGPPGPAGTGGTDAAVAGYVNNSTSATIAALANVVPQIFKPERYGAVGDGSTDDSTAFSATLAACQAAGGGTISLSAKTYRLNGALAPAFTGSGTSTLQKPMRITGPMSGGWNGYWSASPLNGGAVLDLRYDGSDGLHPAKFDTRGGGALELDHITIVSGGTDDFPLLQTTNTTMHIHHNVFLGNSAKSGTACVQDAVIFGGTTATVGNTATAPFQGYGSRVHDNGFSHIRYGFLGRAFCNSVPVENNTFSTTCGNSAGGAIKFDGQGGAVGFAVGNSTRGNTVEVSHYKYGIELVNSDNGNFGPDGYFDPSATHQAAVFVDTTCIYNEIVDGYRNDNYQFVLDPGQTSTWRTAHQSQLSVFRQPQRLTGLFPHIVVAANESSIWAAAANGHLATLRCFNTAYPWPTAVLSTVPGGQVFDAVTNTTPGTANIVTSATAAFTARDEGMPISGAGIPGNTVILSYNSPTQVTMSKDATVAASGVTLSWGRGALGTITDQIQFSRQHIITQGTVGTATPTANAGTGATASAAGTDVAFTLTLTTGTAPAAGTQCNIGPGAAWSVAPKVCLTPTNAAAATAMSSAGLWMSKLPGLITLNAVSALPASTVLTFDVIAVQ